MCKFLIFYNKIKNKKNFFPNNFFLNTFFEPNITFKFSYISMETYFMNRKTKKEKKTKNQPQNHQWLLLRG